MFSDPWIMLGSGVMIAIIGIAFFFRLYQRVVNKAENKTKTSNTSD